MLDFQKINYTSFSAAIRARSFSFSMTPLWNPLNPWAWTLRNIKYFWISSTITRVGSAGCHYTALGVAGKETKARHRWKAEILYTACCPLYHTYFYWWGCQKLVFYLQNPPRPQGSGEENQAEPCSQRGGNVEGPYFPKSLSLHSKIMVALNAGIYKCLMHINTTDLFGLESATWDFARFDSGTSTAMFKLPRRSFQDDIAGDATAEPRIWLNPRKSLSN